MATISILHRHIHPPLVRTLFRSIILGFLHYPIYLSHLFINPSLYHPIHPYFHLSFIQPASIYLPIAFIHSLLQPWIPPSIQPCFPYDVVECPNLYNHINDYNKIAGSYKRLLLLLEVLHWPYKFKTE